MVPLLLELSLGWLLEIRNPMKKAAAISAAASCQFIFICLVSFPEKEFVGVPRNSYAIYISCVSENATVWTVLVSSRGALGVCADCGEGIVFVSCKQSLHKHGAMLDCVVGDVERGEKRLRESLLACSLAH